MERGAGSTLSSISRRHHIDGRALGTGAARGKETGSSGDFQAATVERRCPSEGTAGLHGRAGHSSEHAGGVDRAHGTQGNSLGCSVG